MRHIPNILTSLNLASGFIAVLFASSGNLTFASWLILAAMIFDFSDGFSARLLKAWSPIGKELDSLADIVSFGVAPALIIYMTAKNPEYVSSSVPALNNYGFLRNLAIYLTVLMPVCAGLRLAKFNIDETQRSSFRGLPTPANALAVISFVIAAHYSDSSFLNSLISSEIFLIVITLSLSFLMVSRIPLLSLKFSSLRFSGNEGRYLLAIIVAVLLLILGIAASPLIIVLYIIISLLSGRFRRPAL